MSQWQPIETAPKDERQILGWNARHGMAIVAWVLYGGGKWDVVHDHEDHAWSLYAPTHWMPLPEPPR